MVNNVPPDQMGRLRNNPNLSVLASPTNRVMFVTIRTDRKPFTDKRVRQAMNYAIDREALTQGLMGGMAPISRAPLPSAVYGFHDGLTPYKYDPERAKKLLAEAGATGATFNFGAPNGRYLMDKQVGEAIAGYLEAVGFKVVFENPAWSTFVSEVTKFEKAKYDGYLFGWGVGSGEPDQLLGEHFHSANTKRTMHANAEVDRLIVDAREQFDDARVRADYRKAQEILWDECPWIWLYEQPEILAINKKLRASPAAATSTCLFWNASIEGIELGTQHCHRLVERSDLRVHLHRLVEAPRVGSASPLQQHSRTTTMRRSMAERLAHGRLDAAIGGAAADDDGVAPEHPQQLGDARAMERARPALQEDVVLGSRGDLVGEFRVVAALDAVRQRGHAGRDAQVGRQQDDVRAVRPAHGRRVDDRQCGRAGGADQPHPGIEDRPHGLASRRIARASGRGGRHRRRSARCALHRGVHGRPWAIAPGEEV